MGSGYLLVQAGRLARAPHLASAPCLSFSSFCASLPSPENEHQHFGDSVGVPVMIALFASGLVVEDAVVAVSGLVLWSDVAVAFLWHVVAVVPSVNSIFDVSVVGGCCPVRSCGLGGGPCAFPESGSSAPSLIILSSISFSASNAIRTCSFAHLIAVAPRETFRLLPSMPMTLTSPIQWPCD